MSQGFLLDTPVFSDLQPTAPAAEVLAWFSGRAAALVHASSVIHAEILTGIALLPDGKRPNALARAAQAMFTKYFVRGCILSFDRAATEHCATIVAGCTQQLRPINTEDAQMAAIAPQAGLPQQTLANEDLADIPGLYKVNSLERPLNAPMPHLPNPPRPTADASGTWLVTGMTGFTCRNLMEALLKLDLKCTLCNLKKLDLIFRA